MGTKLHFNSLFCMVIFGAVVCTKCCPDPNLVYNKNISSYTSYNFPDKINIYDPTSYYYKIFINTMGEIGFDGSDIEVKETDERGVFSEYNRINHTRSILYNTKYLDSVYNKTNDQNSIKSICLHELAHQFYNHPIKSDLFSQAYEIQADKYSGFQMRKLDASLKQALAAISYLGNPHATPTHPDLSSRLNAITEGFYQADALITKDSTRLKTVLIKNKLDAGKKKLLDSIKNTLGSKIKGRSKWPTYKFEIQTVYELLNDDVYLQENNVILKRNKTIIGSYVESKVQGTDTVILIEGVSYFLDKHGKIWCINPDGSRMIVGKKGVRIDIAI